jgi:hypothetical protein
MENPCQGWACMNIGTMGHIDFSAFHPLGPGQKKAEKQEYS